MSLLYLFHNPYRVSRKYLERWGADDVHLYGETPLKTLEVLGKMAGLGPEDHLFELGCGRGKGAFFFRDRFGCRVTAIEQIPLFIRKARQVNWLTSAGVTFQCGDYSEADLSGASVIYLYGTCLSDEEIERLCEKFLPHQRILSVSFPLSDYDSQFRVVKKVDAQYPWGETEVYLCQKRL